MKRVSYSLAAIIIIAPTLACQLISAMWPAFPKSYHPIAVRESHCVTFGPSPQNTAAAELLSDAEVLLTIAFLIALLSGVTSGPS